MLDIVVTTNSSLDIFWVNSSQLSSSIFKQQYILNYAYLFSWDKKSPLVYTYKLSYITYSVIYFQKDTYLVENDIPCWTLSPKVNCRRGY